VVVMIVVVVFNARTWKNSIPILAHQHDFTSDGVIPALITVKFFR